MPEGISRIVKAFRKAAPLGTPKYRYELLLPLYENEHHPIDPNEFLRIRDRLGAKFGGYRFQPAAPYHGFWEHLGVVYEDEALLFIVDGPREKEGLRWFQAYKEELKMVFRQIEIYLTVSEVVWL
ncbi:hypothetical protein HYR99_16770 [Candidatus Poribacteria bacterium]|nr:hypothetical protein [Candidatus Poribacteria bacterium]